FILEGLKECSIIAGHHGLGRGVQFVNISDAPDIIDYLREDHLRLTTGFAFKDDIDAFCRLIRQMHALNCSGMVIKINRFIKHLPDDIKLLADELGFPIIDLPTERTLGDLSRHILNYLNDHEAEQLYHALHAQEVFSNMMIKGFDVNRLIEQLEHFLGRPVLLLNHRGEKIAHSPIFRTHDMKKEENRIITHIKNNLHSAREGAVYRSLTEKTHSVSTLP